MDMKIGIKIEYPTMIEMEIGMNIINSDKDEGYRINPLSSLYVSPLLITNIFTYC